MTNLVTALITDLSIHEALITTLVASIGVFATTIRVIGPLIDQGVQAWAARREAAIEKRLPGTWAKVLKEAAIFGAQVAEQMSLAQHISQAADTKKRYAIEAGQRWLKAQGYTVDLTLLGDEIESVILAGLHLPPPKPNP